MATTYKNSLAHVYDKQPCGKKQPKSRSRCFVSYRKNGTKANGDVRMTLSVNIPGYIAEKWFKTVGKKVDFGFDGDGNLYFWPGEYHQLSPNGNDKEVSSYCISIGIALFDYLKQMGEFKRLYAKPEFLEEDGEPYVKLTLTGERKVS